MGGNSDWAAAAESGGRWAVTVAGRRRRRAVGGNSDWAAAAESGGRWVVTVAGRRRRGAERCVLIISAVRQESSVSQAARSAAVSPGDRVAARAERIDPTALCRKGQGDRSKLNISRCRGPKRKTQKPVCSYLFMVSDDMLSFHFSVKLWPMRPLK